MPGPRVGIGFSGAQLHARKPIRHSRGGNGMKPSPEALPNFEDIQSLLKEIPTPAYVIEEKKLRQNAQILNTIRQTTGCKILLALKAYAAWKTFPILIPYLDGACASSVNEARLGKETFPKEVHTFSPAYSEKALQEILTYSDHVIFNSAAQWHRFQKLALAQAPRVEFGIRINPEHSEVATAIYDPCAPGSRLGMTLDQMAALDWEGISGLHVHTLCEKNADALARTIEVVEKKFNSYLKRIKWLNLGGGHLITKSDYNRKLVCDILTHLKTTYGIQLYLEPGQAIGYEAGVLVAEVLDISRNKLDIAILNTSATTHMPDVLEMPYTPKIVGAQITPSATHPHTYRLGGMTCLAGDIIGTYSFQTPLKPGDKLIFEDMAHYTMVKNTTFNGIDLPDILLLTQSTHLKTLKTFNYTDFKTRLS